MGGRIQPSTQSTKKNPINTYKNPERTRLPHTRSRAHATLNDCTWLRRAKLDISHPNTEHLGDGRRVMVVVYTLLGLLRAGVRTCVCVRVACVCVSRVPCGMLCGPELIRAGTRFKSRGGA